MVHGTNQKPSRFASKRFTITTLLLAASMLISLSFIGPAQAARPASHTHVKATINIGTKLFAEEYLMGDMYDLLLTKAGFKVNMHKLGETPILQAAILKGQIDMYPEYTGTGLQTLGITKIVTNAIQAYDTVSTKFQQRWHLTWLHQSPMNDTNGVGVTAATSAKYHLRTLSDLAKVAPQLSFMAMSACKGRPDCLGGFKRVYGINFKKVTYLDSAPLRYTALKNGQVDAIEIFTTDGPIKANHLVVLADNKHAVFPADHVAPVVRTSILNKYPKIRTVLNKLARYVTTKEMIALNVKAVLNSQDPMVVARNFLKSKHLL
jgi:osmoprotectant transport system substrate-binding protein